MSGPDEKGASFRGGLVGRNRLSRYTDHSEQPSLCSIMDRWVWGSKLEMDFFVVVVVVATYVVTAWSCDTIICTHGMWDFSVLLCDIWFYWMQNSFLVTSKTLYFLLTYFSILPLCVLALVLFKINFLMFTIMRNVCYYHPLCSPKHLNSPCSNFREEQRINYHCKQPCPQNWSCLKLCFLEVTLFRNL